MMERNSAKDEGNEKPFICQIYVIFNKYLSLFWKGLEIFLNPRQTLIVPLSNSYPSLCQYDVK